MYNPGDVWKALTSTVGLVVTSDGSEPNVMAAEWTYLVDKDPLMIALGLRRSTLTGELLLQSGRANVTFASEGQAALCDFAGSFTGRSIPKTSAPQFEFRVGSSAPLPYVAGGLFAAECETDSIVELPNYRLFVMNVKALHIAEEELRPLVKHGAMHTLGRRLVNTDQVVAAFRVKGQALTIAAVGPASESSEWQLDLSTERSSTMAPARTVLLTGNEYGDLEVTVTLEAEELAAARLGDLTVMLTRGPIQVVERVTDEAVALTS